tara:strand:+ start:1494 stop:1901 length:408 start_codon:yes stop_codon:yes gene_type:complete
MKMIKKANDLMELSVKIQKAVEISCVVCNINKKAFHSKSRLRHIVDARRLVYTYCRDMLRMSWIDIGASFKINHATAIHHCRVHQQLIESDDFYQSKNDSFLKLIKEEITLFDIEKLILLAKKIKSYEEDISQEK